MALGLKPARSIVDAFFVGDGTSFVAVHTRYVQRVWLGVSDRAWARELLASAERDEQGIWRASAAGVAGDFARFSECGLFGLMLLVAEKERCFRTRWCASWLLEEEVDAPQLSRFTCSFSTFGSWLLDVAPGANLTPTSLDEVERIAGYRMLSRRPFRAVAGEALPSAPRVARGAAARYVYLIRNTNTGNVKIGVAGNPARRLRDLQIAQDAPLSLVDYFAGDELDEGELHRQFADRRVRGEWFLESEEIKQAYVARRLRIAASSASERETLESHAP